MQARKSRRQNQLAGASLSTPQPTIINRERPEAKMHRPPKTSLGREQGKEEEPQWGFRRQVVMMRASFLVCLGGFVLFIR